MDQRIDYWKTGFGSAKRYVESLTAMVNAEHAVERAQKAIYGKLMDAAVIVSDDKVVKVPGMMIAKRLGYMVIFPCR